VVTEAIDPVGAKAFFELDSVALVGASDDKKHFSNTVYRALKDHAVHVVPVNPNEAAVAGDECYADLAAVPGDVGGVIVMVNHERAVDIVHQAIDRGVGHVWLFKGLGHESAVSDEAIALCHEHGVDVVPGACPLMFLRPVHGMHRVHRGIRRIKGQVRRAS
jgi:predicted CoA-binding protein